MGSCWAEAEGEEDSVVKIELEAAEALADLADSGVGIWGRKGKRGMKPQTQSQGQHEDFRRAKPKQKAPLQRQCSTSHSSFGGGRSRQNLTEAEKEARKIRRILANRESARQTIRRRQAICEELAKKAADLSEKNGNLKREKELALKVYQSLETMNRDLKARVATLTKVAMEVVEETQGGTKVEIDVVEETQGESKAEREVAVETQGEAKSCQGNIPTSQPNSSPLLFYDRPSFTPLFWPAMIQSSNPSHSQQHGPQNPTFLPSNVSVPIINKPEFSKKPESLVNINGSMTPIYLLPCPLFFPLPNHAHGLHHQPFFCADNKQEDNSVSSACITSKNVANIELNGPAFSIKAKIADSGSVEGKPVNDHNESLVECSQDGGSSTKIVHSKGTFLSLAPASCTSVHPSTTEKHAESHNDEVCSSTASRNISSFPEQNQEQDTPPSHQSVEAFAAAEARRRRKELTKLKNLNSRRMYS